MKDSVTIRIPRELATKMPFGGEVMVARTVSKDRCDVEAGEWHKETRVRRLTPTDCDKLRMTGVVGQFGMVQEFVVESRRVNTLNGVPVPIDPDWSYAEWRFWTTGPTLADAINDVIGDSDYRKAVSLIPEHALLVKRVNEFRAANERQHNAKLALDATWTELERFKQKTQQGFDKKCAGKTEVEIEKIKDRVVKKMTPELTRLRAACTEADKEFQEAKGRVEFLEKHTFSLNDWPELVEQFAVAAVA